MAKFNKRFSIELGVEEGKRRFVNRVLNFLFLNMVRVAVEVNRNNGWSHLEQYLCSRLGERYDRAGCLERLIGDDFDKCLQVLEALYEYPPWKSMQDQMEWQIRGLLSETEVDIGVRWEDGQFLPAGSPVMDNALVNDSLNLLNMSEYKGVSVAFQKGLNHYLHSTKDPSLLTDVLTDMYEALEAMAKIVCPKGKDRDLSCNCEAFISNLGLADPYKKMLKAYIEYANDFARHAGPQGKPKPIPSRKEVEAFMYLTGLFIRVAFSKNS
jgi:hypothetical protein